MQSCLICVKSPVARCMALATVLFARAKQLYMFIKQSFDIAQKNANNVKRASVCMYPYFPKPSNEYW